MRNRGSTDILAEAYTRLSKKSQSESEERVMLSEGIHRSPSHQQQQQERSQQQGQEQLPRVSPHTSTLDEIAKLTQAVEESIQLSLGNSDSITRPPEPPASILEPSLFEKDILPKLEQDGVGPQQGPLVIRRSVDKADKAYTPQSLPASHESKMVLVQSYRTISVEDVQESALGIYRKYLIQLRTASMAAEETAAAAATVSPLFSKETAGHTGQTRPSFDRSSLPAGFDSYAERVIAEWNEKWRGSSPESRRLRRLSNRKSATAESKGNYAHNEDHESKDSIHDHDIQPSSKESSSQYSSHAWQAEKDETTTVWRRSGAGFTAFLNRLLRTETTILELPTLTINTTTVEEAAASDDTGESNNEEEEYDSEVDEDDEADEDEDGRDHNSNPEEVKIENAKEGQPDNPSTPTHGRSAVNSPRSSLTISRSSWDRDSHGLEQEETALPSPISAGPQRTLIPIQRDGARGVRPKSEKISKMTSSAAKNAGWKISSLLNNRLQQRTSVSSLDTIRVTPLGSPKTGLPSDDASRTVRDGTKEKSARMPDLEQGLQTVNSSEPPSSTFAALSGSPSSLHRSTSATAPRQSTVTSPSSGAHASSSSSRVTAFYLPLECRQRIHVQVLEEGRTEAPYLFGPAKGFVLEVVLRDHYYPLFLEHVQRQNLGLARHLDAGTRLVGMMRGMLGLGIVLWILVLSIQVTLVLVGLGGWASLWVWVVGVPGGWLGTVFLATAMFGFSPILGLFGRNAENKHGWRLCRIVDPSIQTLHFRRSVWMLACSAVFSLVATVVFAALGEQ
ncbi:hypothetical protein BGZ94_007310 [Podila epigama]|nr:hypothetical protein BGZ94_007310 [Podila epigama]